MQEDEQERERQDRYWRSNLWLIVGLLGVWFVVSYGCGIFLVEYLNQFQLGSIPLGFWFAQQGSIYVFVLLIFVYAWGMDALGNRHDGSPENERGEQQ